MASYLLFQELIERLRREELSVGPDQVLRLFALLEQAGAVGPEELKTLICPIFASSGEEQQRFYRAYDEFFSIRVAAIEAPPKRRTLSIPLPRAKVLAPVSTAPERKGPFTAKRLIVGAALLVLVAVLLVLGGGDAPSLVVPVGRRIAPEPVTTTTEIAQTKPPAAKPWGWALAAGLILFGAEMARTILRWLHQQTHRGEGRPFDWPLRDTAPSPLFTTSAFFRASRLLKGREPGEYARLDIRRTIASTIRALGDPTFEYAIDRRVTEYLFLIERLSERDHLAACARTLTEAFVRDGMLLEVYEYESDPRLCARPGTTVRISTTDLHHRYPQHRLIVIGTATPFTDPVTGEAHGWIPRAFPWGWRALLTPEDEATAAKFVAPWFDVFALGEDGLLRLAERWQYTDAAARPIQRRHRDVSSPDELPFSVRRIQELLEPALFAWLQRCAVHPTLQWDLTRALAPPLSDEKRLGALVALARLPWFRHGRIPETVRLALMRNLAEDEGENDRAHEIALSILATTTPPPVSSVAARSLEIQELAHRIWRVRDDRAALRPLLRTLRRFTPDLIVRDRALLQLLSDAPGQPMARRLPAAAKRLLFRQGIPAFGAHSFLALLLILPLVLYAGTRLNEGARPAVEAPGTTSPTEPSATDTVATDTVATDTAATGTIADYPPAAAPTTNTSEPDVPVAAPSGSVVTDTSATVEPVDELSLGSVATDTTSTEESELPVTSTRDERTQADEPPSRYQSTEQDYKTDCDVAATSATVTFNLSDGERILRAVAVIVSQRTNRRPTVEVSSIESPDVYLLIRNAPEASSSPRGSGLPCTPGIVTIRTTATIRTESAATN